MLWCLQLKLLIKLMMKSSLSEMHSNKKENCNETSVYEDSYTLQHQPDEVEYLVPSSENAKLW